jgi:hypothetical protein
MSCDISRLDWRTRSRNFRPVSSSRPAWLSRMQRRPEVVGHGVAEALQLPVLVLQIPNQLGLLGGLLPRDLLVGPEHLGLTAKQVRLLRQFHEHGHLRAHELRHDGLHHVVHRAHTVATHGLSLALVGGGEEDDWRVPGLVAVPDQGGGLEPVHVRHLHIQKDHGEVVGEKPFQRLAPRLRPDEVLPEALEHRLERHEVGRLVVDQEDVDSILGGRSQRGTLPGGRLLGRHRRGCRRRLRRRARRGTDFAHRYSHTRSSETSWSMSTGLAM